MSSLITNATIQIRKDTAGNWTSNNPTPAAGEWCLETDTTDYKIGDGSTAWTSLLYANAHPIGSQYIQYAVSDDNDPLVSLPNAEAPTALFGGTWEKLWETESIFFRTEGTLADTDRTDGLQEDQFQGHEHSYTGQTSNAAVANNNIFQGGDNTAETTTAIVTDGVNGTPRTGLETRVKNRLMRIWRKTA